MVADEASERSPSISLSTGRKHHDHRKSPCTSRAASRCTSEAVRSTLLQVSKVDSWTWSVLLWWAKLKLIRMRNDCNRHGEAAGHGDSDMDADKFIHWCAHHFSRLIKGLKESGIPNYAIPFHMLDRWGLPLVPWTYHPCVASLCRRDDHGIAMKFGLRGLGPFEVVQPCQRL